MIVSPPRVATATEIPTERGFAMLVLLAITGIFGVVAVTLFEHVTPARSDTEAVTAVRVAEVTDVAREVFRRTGTFPTTIDALASSANLAADGEWRRDPWLPGSDLDYRVRSRALTLRSRGPDRRWNTADDVIDFVDDEPLVRLRQRGRLRILRAVLAASSYRIGWTMSAGENATMRAAMRDYAAARRAWFTTDPDARPALTDRMTAATATVEALVSAHGLRSMPDSLTGNSGLATALGLPTSRIVDGVGRRMDLDPVVGFAVRGSDRQRGTDDDM